MKILLCLTSLFILNSISFSQNQKGIFRKDFFTDNYKITIENNEVDFFTGSISVTDLSENKEVLTADSFYTRYNWDTLIDMNNDGSNEFILDLATGINMYNYNMYLIFDFKQDVSEPLEIHNSELEANVDVLPKIVSYVRLSPAVMGAGYSYSLKYENGNLVSDRDPKTSKVLKNLIPNGKDDLYLINEYAKGFDECGEASEVNIYYEAYITQLKITGNEKKGWRFFDKNYKCKDKGKIRKKLKKKVDSNYLHLNNPDNYRFSGNSN